MSDEERAEMAHLMRRAGFGATPDELDVALAKGYDRVIDELLDPGAYGIPRMDVSLLARVFPSVVGGFSKEATNHHIWYLVSNPRPLEEKMSLFWHSVFATGVTKVDCALELTRQMDMLRNRGMGNYHELLVELAKDPAMIYWLDNNENHRDQPNENWGRELLELFSMGQGNYTEEDVFECARAFTGWTIAPKPPSTGLGQFAWDFEYREEDHDDGEKHFLGQRGKFNGEDVIDIVVRQPATSRFIARHLYNFFVADEVQVPAWLHTPPRDPVAINLIADAFVSSNYEMTDTLRMIFKSDFFKESRFKRVKSPAETIAGLCKLVGDFKYPRLGLELLGLECWYMGQYLSDPPSVEGWNHGHEWIDSGSLVKRINLAADAVSNIAYPGVQAMVDRMRGMGEMGPDEAVDACLDMLGPVWVEDDTREELMTNARMNGGLQWETDDQVSESTQRVADILALIVATREYQFC